MNDIPLLPLIGDAEIALLEKLSNANAVSGDEGEVRAIVLEQVRPLVDEVKVDALGNVLAVRKARQPGALRVMLAAHMDEIGFMLTSDGEDGLFSFALVGGIDERILPGKPVKVGKDHVPGVIGAKPIHLQEEGEDERSIPVDSLKIDLGPGGENKAKKSDRATFATTFQRVGPSLIGKALDNRLGVATIIELLRQAPDSIELIGAFTVQEEIGLRGARVAAYASNPDLAIAIDSTPAYDLPLWDGSENTVYNTRLGAGPAIYLTDSSTLSDPRIIQHLVRSAEAESIPYQFRQPGGGGTDAGAIHKQRAGIPSVSVSVPGRYAHTPALVVRLEDWQNTLRLLHSALRRLTPDVLAEPRP